MGELVYLFSYPSGGGLAVSLVDNDVIEPSNLKNVPHFQYGNRIFYRAPTQPGASGAPVFNEFWELIAMHVAGYPRVGNCGVRIQPVIEGIINQLRQRPAPLAHSGQSRAPASAPSNSLQERASQLPKTPSMTNDVSDTPTTLDNRFQSTFISYSRKDSTFANRLHTALQSQGIRAWLDEIDLVPGSDLNDEIARAVSERDKVLLCCSKASLEQSWWVDRELSRLFDKELRLQKQEQKKVLALIPLDLDGYLYDGWDGSKADLVRGRTGVDFQGWEDESKFEKAFKKLLRGLQPAGRRVKPAP